jgi:hypothetical protein
MKEWRDTETDHKKNFVKQGTNRPDHAQLMKQYQLQQLMEPGLKEIKQVELWTKWRKCIPHQFQYEMCPEPDAAVLQRIKNEKNEKLKQAAKKKKKSELPPMDDLSGTVTAMWNELGNVTAMETL